MSHLNIVSILVLVLALKEQIANVTGVLSEQQRLICRGKVLKDEELLSAYCLNDANRITSSTSGLVFGPFSLSDQGDPTTSDLSRILSSVIGSFGRGNVRGAEGNDATPHSGGFRPQTAHPTASTGFNPFLGDFQFPSTQPPENQHPTVIPDSSTTLTHYINHIRREFDVNGGGLNTDSQASNIDGTEGQSYNSQSHFSARHGLPTPESLSEVILSARRLLIEQAGECLADLARQLQNQATVSDSQARASVQSNSIRFGALIQNLGPLLLELGRTIMTLRMGQAPGEAVVNAGPAVFVSDASPTPIMVQAGTTFSGFPLGTSHTDHGPAFSFGPGLLSRNIDIHIRRGHSASVGTTNLASQSNEQPSERTDAPRNSVDNSGNQAHQGVPTSSSGRESSVRVVPIRTVIAIPGVSRPPTSGNADSYPHPLFARLHQQMLGNMNDASNPPASGEHTTDGRAQSRVSSPTLQSSSFGWIDEQLERIHNNLPTNSVSVASETAPTNGQRSDPLASSSSLHRSCDGTSEDRTQGCEREVVSQDGAHAFARFVSSELQGNATDTEAQEAADHGNEDGVFFSSLLHRLMPFISQIATSEPSVTSRNPSISSEQAEVQNSMHVRDIDPSDAPASKRKRSD